jgi:hypothetical protein
MQYLQWWKKPLAAWSMIASGSMFLTVAVEHEKNWSRSEEIRQALDDTRTRMIKYADTLGEVAGVPSLIAQESKRDLG